MLAAYNDYFILNALFIFCALILLAGVNWSSILVKLPYKGFINISLIGAIFHLAMEIWLPSALYHWSISLVLTLMLAVVAYLAYTAQLWGIAKAIIGQAATLSGVDSSAVKSPDAHGSAKWRALFLSIIVPVVVGTISLVLFHDPRRFLSSFEYSAHFWLLPKILAMVTYLSLFLFLFGKTGNQFRALAVCLMIAALSLLVSMITSHVYIDDMSAHNHLYSFGYINWLSYFLVIVALLLTDQETDRATTDTIDTQVKYLNYHDQLTGLLNRNTFIERLDQYTFQRRNSDFKTMLVLVGLDDFKKINESATLNDGDRVLVSVANRLQNHCPTASSIARLDGDVFGLVFERIKEQATIDLLMSKIASVFESDFRTDGGKRHKVSCSIGISLAPDHGITTESLIKSAEYALYHSKAEGGNQTTNYETWMSEGHERDRKLQLELKDAFEHDQFVLHFQPLVSVNTGHINGFEVLVRWQHPTEGLMSPAMFLPALERMNLMPQLDRVVLEKSLSIVSQWYHHYQYSSYLSVNLSPLLFQDPELPVRIEQQLKKYDIPPDCLQLEIVESTAIQDIQLGVDVLSALKSLKIAVALDDFGTGYSSMSYLRQLPVDKIKIDRSFIQSLEEDATSASIVKAISSLAHGLGKTVVAEGIESPEQFAFIKQFGCEEAQGFDLYRPITEERALELLLQQKAVVSSPS